MGSEMCIRDRTNNVGFEISDEGLVVIPQSGTYIIFVDLGSKTISIQKPVIYGYGTAAGGNNEKILPFTESSDGKTFSVTLPNGGRFRIHPYIPAFDNLNPSFGAWKREYAVNPETLEIYLRCLLYTSPSPRDGLLSRMPSSA